MRAVIILAGAAAALAFAGAAQACTTIAPSVVIEFADGSAEIDAVDQAEIAEFFARARQVEDVPEIKVRAFADRTGSFEASTWAEVDLALARARAQALADALMLIGAPSDAPILRGVAPEQAETRIGADGVARHGRAVAWVDLPSQPPRKDDGRPVPTC